MILKFKTLSLICRKRVVNLRVELHKYLLILMILSFGMLDASEAHKSCSTHVFSLGAAKLMFDEHGHPCPELLQICYLTGMPPLDPHQQALQQINAWAQENFLRYHERWDTQTRRFDALAPQLLPLLDQLGLTQAHFPSCKQYRGAIVLGATLARVRLRLEHLVELWQQGIRFDDLYFLSAERPLVKEETLADYPLPPQILTESQMMCYVWEHLTAADIMKKSLHVHLICSAMKNMVRPNSIDTIQDWLCSSPPPGHYLVISNAPHIYRQDFAFQARIPEIYSIETVGPKTQTENMVLLLDELARLIFDLCTCLNK